ncbi:glycosyltransferase family 25 protein [Pantoea sp. T14]|uniref:glycosyltransferase family 25 protein n=1 Tax=Pantoea sp. T14 TaxID=3085685 RepID=UPI002FCAC360
MSEINWDLIDQVVYINLAERNDRRVNMRRELKKLGVPQEKITRFEAIAYQPGYIGCAQSHLQVLQLAQQQQWKNVLILEDDMAFHHDSASAHRLNKFFAALTQINWHVAFLTANYVQVTPFKSADYLIKAHRAFCACAYIVNASYLPVLIENISESIEQLLLGGAQHHYALDVHWMPLMQRDIWLGLFPNLGYQRPGRSDIEKGAMDYRHLFYKPLSKLV